MEVGLFHFLPSSFPILPLGSFGSWLCEQAKRSALKIEGFVKAKDSIPPKPNEKGRVGRRMVWFGGGLNDTHSLP